MNDRDARGILRVQSHLVFYDASCPLCVHFVEQLIVRDTGGFFFFAPLQGETAQRYLAPAIQRGDTMVLVENFHSRHPRIWMRGRGVFRIFWLLGGRWRWVGWLCFCPFGVDLLYRAVARHRHLFKRSAGRKGEGGRFLP